MNDNNQIWLTIGPIGTSLHLLLQKSYLPHKNVVNEISFKCVNKGSFNKQHFGSMNATFSF